MKVQIISFLLFLCCGSLYGATENDFSIIKDKIRLDNIVENSDSIVNVVLSHFNDDGSFNDIDYTLKDRTVWPPIEHLDRLIAMAYSYNKKNGKYYSDKLFFSQIE